MRNKSRCTPLITVSQLNDAFANRDRINLRVESGGAVIDYELKRVAAGIRLTAKFANGTHREVVQVNKLPATQIGFAIGRSVVSIKH